MRAESEYRRDLAEAALARLGGPATAAEVLEAMGALAQGEGHPARCWRGLSLQQVAGALRTLERDEVAVRGVDRATSKRSRPDPTWLSTEHAASDVPQAPDEDSEPASGESPAIRGPEPYTPVQVRTLLDVGDELFGVVGRFMHDLREHNARARRRLEEVGLL